MKVIELVKISSPALKMLSENEVCHEYWRYTGLYEEFHQMRELGVKYAEAVRMLAEDYGIGRATVERAVAVLGREVKPVDTSARQGHGRGCVKRPRRVRAGSRPS